MLLLLAVPSAQAAQSVIVVLGDSLSAGHGIDRDKSWVSLLQKQLNDEDYDYRVINASISGDTTAGGLSRMPAALARFHPRIVIVELGGNDGLRGLPLEETQSNLARIIETARKSGARVLLLGIRLPPNYGAEYTRRFAAIYSKLAKKYGVPLVPFLLKGIATHPNLMQADGIHPTAQAQPRMLDLVWPKLKPLLSGSGQR